MFVTKTTTTKKKEHDNKSIGNVPVAWDSMCFLSWWKVTQLTTSATDNWHLFFIIPINNHFFNNNFLKINF